MSLVLQQATSVELFKMVKLCQRADRDSTPLCSVLPALDLLALARPSQARTGPLLRQNFISNVLSPTAAAAAAGTVYSTDD